jgi:hypothetical protein
MKIEDRVCFNNKKNTHNLKLQVRDGFTPIGSASFDEYAMYRDFMAATGDPMFTVAIVRAKDNGSMVRTEHLRVRGID